MFSLYRLVETADGYDVRRSRSPAVSGHRQLRARISASCTPITRTPCCSCWSVTAAAGLVPIGERLTDIRVFRWSISPQGEVRYIDNRGERDVVLPARTISNGSPRREMVVNGRHPHINILDTVFVETIGGDLTVKIENNTEDGLGLYREPVQDQTQSLDDAQIQFAKVGGCCCCASCYREEQWRYLAYNTLTQKVQRIDGLGQACIQLPEDHGIIWPGGYLLQNGDTHQFDSAFDGMRFKRMIRSPNGEDVLYVSSTSRCPAAMRC